MVLEKRILSDNTITPTELEQLEVETFSEILPILDKLVATDLLNRLPTERASAYAPMPMMTMLLANHSDLRAEMSVLRAVMLRGGRRSRPKLDTVTMSTC